MTRTQMRRENAKAGDAGFWNAYRMSSQESAARLVAGSQETQRQPEEGEMAVAPMLLQSLFYDLSFTGLLLPWGFLHAP